MSNQRFLSMVCLSWWLAACPASHGVHPHPTAGWAMSETPTAPDTAQGPDGLPAAADFLVIADTHASYPLAPHELHSNDYVTDSIFTAAVRPPQIDFWGTRVLAWILHRSLPVKAILHLGDAANISCVYEFERFTEEIDRRPEPSRVPWFYTPGNHDSLLMGNFAYEAPAADSDTRWGRECGAAQPMDKQMLIRKYIDAKHWSESLQDNALSDEVYACHDVVTDSPKVRSVVCHKRPPDDDPQAFEWGDFILQTIQMDTSFVILLDSTDYREKPRTMRIGGVWGGVSDKQARALDWLLAAQPPTEPIVIGTHYTLDALDDDSQHAVERIIRSVGPLAIFTAHTHFPTAARLHRFSGTSADFLEVNVASVVGWPMEFAYLTVRNAPSIELTVASAARILAGPGGAAPSSCDEWVTRGMWDHAAFEYYTHYRRPHGYARLLRHMFVEQQDRFLSTHLGSLPDRLFERELSTVDVTAALGGASPLADRVESYERCQAIFASAADAGDDLRFGTLRAADPGTAHTAFAPDPPAERPQSPIRSATERAHMATWTFAHLPP